MSTKPTVMVSSTFYDLRQIRADLADFIDSDLGYRPLLSELPSFPVEPDRDTIQNCRRRVEKEADILVLVIGGRYGSIPPREDKSVTNLEYLTARRANVPVYAFVRKDVLSIMPVWSDNPQGDYANVVDTTAVFEFIEEVQDQHKVWTTGFETASEIISALRSRFAFLFKDGLELRQRLIGRELPDFLDNIRPDALRIALEKPEAWEYKLFCQTWLDEVDERKDLVRSYDAELTVGVSEQVAAHEAPDWISTRFHELKGLVSSAGRLVNVDAQEGFGEPGSPGDAEVIVWTASQLGKVFEETVSWAQRLRRAHVEEPFEKVVEELVLLPDDTIEKL